MSLIRTHSTATLEQYLVKNEIIFLTALSLMTLDELVKQSEVNQVFAKLTRPYIEKKSIFGNRLPTDLLKMSISPLLSPQENAFLAQTNSFFKTHLEKTLQKMKINYKKMLEKQIDDFILAFDKVLGDNIFPGWTLKSFVIKDLLKELKILNEKEPIRMLGLEFFIYFALAPFMNKKFEYHNRKEYCSIYNDNKNYRLKIYSPPLNNNVEEEFQHYLAEYQKHYPHMNPQLQPELVGSEKRCSLSLDLTPFLKELIFRAKHLTETLEEKPTNHIRI